MAVDPEILDALSTSLTALREGDPRPVPADVLRALAPHAKPGTALTIDLDASKLLGTPLVTVAATATHPLFDGLTKRQREVAVLILAGQSNKDIADTLSISVATVKDHVHAILQHTGLPSRSAVIAASRG